MMRLEYSTWKFKRAKPTINIQHRWAVVSIPKTMIKTSNISTEEEAKKTLEMIWQWRPVLQTTENNETDNSESEREYEVYTTNRSSKINKTGKKQDHRSGHTERTFNRKTTRMMK